MAILKTNISASERCLEALDEFLESRSFDPACFPGNIHPEDEMYHQTVGLVFPTDKAYYEYINSGYRSFAVMEQIAQALFGGFENCGSILEFASGHGRLTRFLSTAVPPGQLWVSDIYESAMEYQRSYFGVDTIQSVADPADLRTDKRFDVITAGSLFTHLPHALFQKWLAKLSEMLTPRGVLFFSIREQYTNYGSRSIGKMPKRGILFTTQTESKSLSTEIYGRTVVTDAYVAKAVARNIGPDTPIRTFRKALYENQDLIAVGAGPDVDLDRLDIKPLPFGQVNRGVIVSQESDYAQFYGWALELTDGEKIIEAQLFVDGVAGEKFELNDASDDRILQYFPGTTNPTTHWIAKVPLAIWESGRRLKWRITSTTGHSIEVYPPNDKLKTSHR